MSYPHVHTDDIYSLLNSVIAERYNLRIDLPELEPLAVTYLMRILLRFVIELEAVEYDGFTRPQLEAYRATVEVC